MPNASMQTIFAHNKAIRAANVLCAPFCDIATRKLYHSDNAILAEHFIPGNVILSDYWREHDLVIAFHPTTAERGWRVEVVRCHADGTPKPFERVRWHYTFPDKRDKVTAHVSQKMAA